MTICEIEPDGNAVVFGLVDRHGVPSRVRLPIEQMGALAMTLPSLIEKALRTRYQDESLRYAYPLGSWALEQASDPATRMMTLRTTDGFSVCFSMPRSTSHALSEALATQPCQQEPIRAH